VLHDTLAGVLVTLPGVSVVTASMYGAALCLSMIPNQTSDGLSQDRRSGLKWTWIRGFAASQWRTSTRLVSGVVIHHQVLLGAGALINGDFDARRGVTPPGHDGQLN
jgi:hypothetical protein